MEILNNIWSALTVENPTLLSILLIPVSFLDHVVMLLIFTSVLRIELSKKQKLIYIFLSSIVSLLLRYTLPDPINIFVNYIFQFLEIHFILKINVLKSILAVVIPTIVYTLTEALLVKPFTLIFNISTQKATSIPIYRLSFIFVMYIFITIICLLIKHLDLKILFIDELSKKNKLILIFTFILGLISLGIQLYISTFYLDVLPLFICIFSFISLLAYFSVSIYTITRVTKLYTTKRELESAEEYNRTLTILHDSVRGFKHDFDNIVSTIGGYVKTNDMEGLKKYYLQLEDDCQRVNNLYTLNPNVINNPGIYNLLTRKYYKANEKNIKINLTFLLDLNTLKMQVYEFSRILGILLDNAIEASSECDEKVINISFRNDEKNHRQLITIENTYANKDVNTEDIFKKGFSGKENHSGLGLWEIRQILNKNNNLNLHTSKTDEFFTQQLEIYY